MTHINEILHLYDFNDKSIIVELMAGKANLEQINISKIFRCFAETIYHGKEVVLAKL